MQLLRNSTRRFSSKNGPASGCRARKAALSQGVALVSLDAVSQYAAMSKSGAPLIRFVREHLRTPWLRWMIRDGTKDSSILDDEPLRQLCLVTFQVATHSKPDVIIPVHELKQEFATMGEDACTEHPLFEVMIQEMITDSEFESLSWHNFNVEIVTQNFRKRVSPAYVQEL